jgi:hypothetical protein
MPLRVWVDADKHVRYAVASGVLSKTDVLEHYGAVLADPAYDPALDMVFDCTAVERVDVEPGTVKHFSELVARADRSIPAGVHPRAAIVAPGDAAYGMARMYQAYREVQQAQRVYRVYRTVAEARRWLGLPHDASEEAAGDASRS